MLTETTTDLNLLQHAQAYDARGWTVIPTKGKRAACPWKCYQRSRPSATALAALFSSDSIDGLAVILGGASGALACRDFDQEDAYHRWAEIYPELAASLPTVRTGRGFHVYSRAPEEMFVLLPDGEYRADSAHYTVLPPSQHPDGATYTWVVPLPDGPLPVINAQVFVPEEALHTQARQGTGATQDTQANSILHVSVRNLGNLLSETLPSGPGQRNKKVFELVRGLMASPGLDTSMKNLREIVTRWHLMALPQVRTKDFDTTWTDFVIAWGRAKFPRGATFALAVARAKAMATPEAGLIYERADYRLVVALCFVLQEKWGTKPFPLSCRKVGEALGIGRDLAWRILQALKADGIIFEVTKGNKDSRKASEWRLITA